MNGMFEAERPLGTSTLGTSTLGTSTLGTSTLGARGFAPLVCRIDIALPPLSLSSLVRRGRGSVYRIGRTGKVAFSIVRTGMFAGDGQAERVDGWLSLTGADGGIAALDLEVDPASVSLRWTDMVTGKRPVRWLPRLHFRSIGNVGASVGASVGAGFNRGIVRGLLDIDGTPRLQAMGVTELDRVRDSITGTEIASYRLDGEIDLASFAIPPDGVLLGDAILLSMRIDVEISPDD